MFECTLILEKESTLRFMKLRRAGIKRLALLVGVIGALLGSLLTIGLFLRAKEEQEAFHRFEEKIVAGVIVRHSDGTLWWKFRGSQGQQYFDYSQKWLEALPDNLMPEALSRAAQKQPSEKDAIWSLILPLLGFLVPWGGIRLIAWAPASFLGRNSE